MEGQKAACQAQRRKLPLAMQPLTATKGKERHAALEGLQCLAPKSGAGKVHPNRRIDSTSREHATIATRMGKIRTCESILLTRLLSRHHPYWQLELQCLFGSSYHTAVLITAACMSRYSNPAHADIPAPCHHGRFRQFQLMVHTPP